MDRSLLSVNRWEGVRGSSVSSSTTAVKSLSYVNSKLNRHLILWFKEKLWTSGNSKRNDKNLAAVFKVLSVFWHDYLWYTSSADETCKACNECFRAQVWYNIKMNGSATSTSVKHDVELLHTIFLFRATLTNNGPVLVKTGFSSTRNWGGGAVGRIAKCCPLHLLAVHAF